MYDQVCTLTCVQVCGQKSASGGILQKPSTQDSEAESVTEMSQPASSREPRLRSPLCWDYKHRPATLVSEVGSRDQTPISCHLTG